MKRGTRGQKADGYSVPKGRERTEEGRELTSGFWTGPNFRS